MTFKLADRHLFWWPVHIPIPDADQRKAGSVSKHTIKLKFEQLPHDELKQIDADYAALPAEERPVMEAFILERVTRDWEGVVDDGNAPIEFSSGNLALATQNIFFRVAAYRAYQHAMSGEGARKGN